MAKLVHAQSIASGVRLVLDPEGTTHVVWDAPISKYLSGGAGALVAFANELNTSAQFSGYGLALGPGDFADVNTVEDVVKAIIRWFQRNGWTVVA